MILLQRKKCPKAAFHSRQWGAFLNTHPNTHLNTHHLLIYTTAGIYDFLLPCHMQVTIVKGQSIILTSPTRIILRYNRQPLHYLIRLMLNPGPHAVIGPIYIFRSNLQHIGSKVDGTMA
jgi:hypothetical protein